MDEPLPTNNRGVDRTNRAVAWEISREVRGKRKLLRQAMAKRQVDAYRVLRGEADPVIEELVSEMRLRQILRFVPGIGSSLTFEIIAAFDSSAETKLGKLSKERRSELADITKGAAVS